MHTHRSTSIAVITRSVGFQIASNGDFEMVAGPPPLSTRSIRFHYGNSLLTRHGRPRHEGDQQYATTSSHTKSGSLPVLRRKNQTPTGLRPTTVSSIAAQADRNTRQLSGMQGVDKAWRIQGSAKVGVGPSISRKNSHKQIKVLT